MATFYKWARRGSSPNRKWARRGSSPNRKWARRSFTSSFGTSPNSITLTSGGWTDTADKALGSNPAEYSAYGLHVVTAASGPGETVVLDARDVGGGADPDYPDSRAIFTMVATSDPVLGLYTCIAAGFGARWHVGDTLVVT